ncbi:RHS repeat domain-containing protein, partial [Flavobacterium branchiophilum]
KYYYVTGYNSTLNPDTLSSSGVLNGIPKYEFSFNNIPSGNSNNSLFSFYLFSINSIANYNPTGNGSHIGYDEVVEVNLDNSYTKHFFTNYGTDINGISHFDEPPLGITGWVPGNQSIYMKYSSKESERGKTIGVFDFNKQDVLIKKRKITYRNDSNRFNDFLKQKIISSEFCPNGNSLLFAVAIKIFKYSYYPTSEEVTSYDLNGLNPITLTKNFSYNTNNQLAIEQITNSTQSNILQTKYFYPCDNTISTEPNFSILCQKNMINTPLKTENYYNSDLLSSQITKYGSFTSNILGQNMLLPQFIYAGKANVLEKKITYDFYDTSGNLTQYTPESGMPVTIIWGYNKTQPIAKFENATNAQVAAALGVANISSLTEANLPAIDALRNSSNTAIQKAMITTYTHKPLIGVSTITDPKGDVMRYNYDTFGRLQNVTDKNGNKLSENEYHYKP